MLSIDKIRKRFGDVVAVNGLSLEVHRGEIFGLLGPNGAGKTTTIAAALGLLRPDSGEVRLDGGGSPHEPGQRARIGLAPQSLSIYDELTGEENLRFFGSLYGMNRREAGRRSAELLEFVGLTERARKRAGTYSGGMKRRLNLAAALVHEPELVMLDEPTAGVDPQSRHAIFGMVESLRQRGRTVVYTTHYMEEAQRLCNRVAVMDHGRLLALGTADELIAEHGGPSRVYVRRADGEQRVETDQPAKELSRLLEAGDAIEARLDRPSLEDVFLNLTGRSLRD